MTLFSEMGNRLITGPATESVAGAREGLWVMHNDPGIAYLCGPMALKNMLLSQGAEPQKIAFISAYRSGNHGVSLTEVGRLAQQAELPHTLIQRQPGQAIPVPSVVHWKVSHYAAIVGEQDGRYHIQDPIFGEDLWVTQKAIDAEASGYFLVPKPPQTPAKTASNGWRTIEVAEADSIFGMGYTGSVDPAATKPQDDKIKPGCNGSRGMCTANASEMTVSLNLNDTPVGYAPPIGPAAYVTLTYNQREAGQPANFGFFNVSAKWAMNWLSYIQDSPTLPGSNVSRYVAGGGFVNYSDYNSSTGAFTPEVYDNSVLVRTASEPIRYERRLPDGSIEVYSASNGATVAPRRIFLTQLIDPAGNAMTLSYDDQMRLTTLTDATGRNTVFTYDFAGNPLLITRVTDPFGRSARIEYDANGRLSKITDVIGLSSSFHYNSASLIDSMTTPYGTTAFSFGESGDRRWLEITDPLGAKERVEYRQQAPGIPYSEPSGQVPQGLIAPFNSYINGRNTFYWDRQAFASGVANYTQARIKHWEHWTKNAGVTSAPVESIKYPLENRTWFSYPGQTTWGAVSGTLDKPIRIARVLDDGSTQLTQLSYNSLGNPTRIIDPLGRETQIEYAANQIDVIRIAQKTGTSSYATLAEFTYDNRHLPLTYQDAAGQTTRYAYTPAGKLSEVINALGQITNYVYDARGYLTQVLNANGATELTLSYDEFSRVVSRTDSEGHTLRYRYDDFDRITQVTYPDGTTEAYAWDKLDLSSVTDREGRTTRYAYNAVRKIVASVDPLNRTLQYGYYPNQTLKSLTDANGNVTTWERDLQSRVTAKIYPDGRTDRYGYDLTSRLRSMTDARGQSKRYGYGRDDRLVKIDYRASTITPSATTPGVSFTYDAWFPRQTAMTDGTGTTQYQYVAPGTVGALQLKQSDGPYLNDTVAYQYDALGRVINRNVGGSEETFSFDALGRNISHTSPLGEFNQSYLGETRQLTDTRHRNGLVGTRREYDDNTNDRRLLSIINTGASRNYQLATRPTNIISSIHETAPLDPSTPSRDWTFNYDDADRLEAANSNDGKHYSYQYDPGDNLTNQVKPDGTQAFIVNNLNQVALINDTQVVGHDANGNQVGDGVRTYFWDVDNRLLAIYFDAEPGRSITFKYDGLGRRVGIVSQNGTTVSETRLLWCGDQICQARSGTDAVTRLYYPEGEVRGSALLYYSRDHLGSVRDVSTVHNGARIASFDYDPYGKTTRSTGRLSPDFRYAGMYYLQEADLYLTQYRVYDPRTARWLSRDPIEENGGVNLYAYVGGNPVNYIDPLGLETVSKQSGVPIPIPRIPTPGTRDESDPSPSKDIGRFFQACYETIDKMFNSGASPEIDPKDIAGKTPDQIDKIAKNKGLIPKGDPETGNGAYIDPVTGKQRILTHPEPDSGCTGPHCHVNNPAGERLDINGNVVPQNSPDAHLPLNYP